MLTTVKGMYRGNDVNFEGEPVLVDGRPKANGLLWSQGWDIPTIWALDHGGQLWMNGGHGGALHPATRDAFYAECRSCDDEGTLGRVRLLLGLKPIAPAWMRAARNQGWTPPVNFNADDYNWNE